MHPDFSASPPLLIVVMGVAGSGKTTIAQALAKHFEAALLDADDFHSAEARRRMASGIPLDDAMRAPWIQAICKHLKTLAKDRRDAVLAFSGLKKIYRDPLRYTGYRTIFLFLDGDRNTILQRMQARRGHFMPPALLDSQFETLEPPADEADAVRLDVSRPLEQLTADAINAINHRLQVRDDNT